MTEYLAENSRLRQLSRRYSEGQIAFGDYRSARREIIEALEAGEVQASAAPMLDEPPSVAVTQPPHAVQDETVFLKTMPPRAVVDDAEAAPAAVAAAAPLAWDNHTRVLAAVLGFLALLALAGLIYVMVL